MAGSSMSALLVAAITMTLEVWNPSISDRSAINVVSDSTWATSPSPPRRRATASTSSMKMMARSCLRAAANNDRMRWAPTPTYFSTKSEPVAVNMGTPDSPATARARRVLPVPGGPVSRAPLGAVAPVRVKRSGSLRNMTSSSSSSLASSQPATSLNRVSGTVAGSTAGAFLCPNRPVPDPPVVKAELPPILSPGSPAG